jgi:hypothetical protein
MRTAGVVGSILGIAISLYAIRELKPTSPLAHLAFAAWTSAPFLMMLFVSLRSRYPAGAVVGVWLCLAGYVYALIDAIVLHPDAQGGLAILFLPIYLVGLFLCSMFVAIVFTNRRESRRGRP